MSRVAKFQVGDRVLFEFNWEDEGTGNEVPTNTPGFIIHRGTRVDPGNTTIIYYSYDVDVLQSDGFSVTIRDVEEEYLTAAPAVD